MRTLAQPLVEVGHTRTGYLTERRLESMGVEPVAVLPRCPAEVPVGCPKLRFMSYDFAVREGERLADGRDARTRNRHEAVHSSREMHEG